MARTVTDAAHKTMLENMAQTWETLAGNPEETIARKKRIAALRSNADKREAVRARGR